MVNNIGLKYAKQIFTQIEGKTDAIIAKIEQFNKCLFKMDRINKNISKCIEDLSYMLKSQQFPSIKNLDYSLYSITTVEFSLNRGKLKIPGTLLNNLWVNKK